MEGGTVDGGTKWQDDDAQLSSPPQTKTPAQRRRLSSTNTTTTTSSSGGKGKATAASNDPASSYNPTYNSAARSSQQPPYISFPQQNQPIINPHHFVLNNAVESSRFHWEAPPQFQQLWGHSGQQQQQMYDSPYYGHSYDITSTSPTTNTNNYAASSSTNSPQMLRRELSSQGPAPAAGAGAGAGGGPSSPSLKRPQPPQPSMSWNTALNVALHSGNEMTIGDVLNMSDLANNHDPYSSSTLSPNSNNSQQSNSTPGSSATDLRRTSKSGGSDTLGDFEGDSQMYDDEALLEPTGVSPRIKPFISKLEYLLSHPEDFKDCLVWDDTGTSFIICHTQPRLLQEVLPRFYQHSNIHSFTRQLNVYGFSRLSPSDLISKLDIASTNDYSGWKHPLFTRADKSQLHLLTPKPSRARMQKKVEKQEAQAHARNEAEYNRQQKQISKHLTPSQHQYAQQNQEFAAYAQPYSQHGGSNDQYHDSHQQRNQGLQQNQPQQSYTSYADYVGHDDYGRNL